MKKTFQILLLLAIIGNLLLSGCAPYYSYNKNFKLQEPISVDAAIGIEASASISTLDIYREVCNNLQEDIIASIFNGKAQDSAPELSVTVEISELAYTCQPWGIIWFTYSLLGVPAMRHVGTAQLSIKLSLSDGQPLAAYKGRSVITQWSGLFYGHENRRGVVIMAASEALTKIKYQIEKDAAKLSRMIAKDNLLPDATLAVADQISPIDTISIAVLTLEGENISRDQVTILTSRLSSHLLQCGAFRLVERQEMEAILKEQGFQQAGCTSSRCAVEIGQLINVEQIVAGSVGYVDGLWIISLRMIDVSKGLIVKTSETETEGSFKEALRNGIADAARKLAQRQ